jgi:hypothetical protein
MGKIKKFSYFILEDLVIKNHIEDLINTDNSNFESGIDEIPNEIKNTLILSDNNITAKEYRPKINDAVVSEIREKSKILSSKNHNDMVDLKIKLNLLSSNTTIYNNLTTESKISLIFLIQKLKELSSTDVKSIRGYNFESYITGLIQGSNKSEDNQSFYDIETTDKKKLQLKFYTYNKKNGILIKKISKDYIEDQINKEIESSYEYIKNSMILYKDGMISKSDIGVQISSEIESFVNKISEIMENLKEEIFQCGYYIIGLNTSTNVKIIILKKEFLQKEFEKLFNRIRDISIYKVKRKINCRNFYKYIESLHPFFLLKGFKIKEECFLIGNGGIISQVNLNNMLNQNVIEYYTINYDRIDKQNDELVKNILKDIEDFSKEAELLKQNFTNMNIKKDSKEFNYYHNVVSRNLTNLEDMVDKVIGKQSEN